MVRDPSTGKYERVRLFVLTLGYSRRCVRLLTWRSSARIWAELHERAFGWLGGTVIRDGLEAMALSFQPLPVARAVVRAANVELALLPRELQLVKSASVEFLKSRSLRP